MNTTGMGILKIPCKCLQKIWRGAIQGCGTSKTIRRKPFKQYCSAAQFKGVAQIE